MAEVHALSFPEGQKGTPIETSTTVQAPTAKRYVQLRSTPHIRLRKAVTKSFTLEWKERYRAVPRAARPQGQNFRPHGDPERTQRTECI
ncbi:hypothetical protein A0H81_14737 [Grifola frondosa]|uniref:Uncharacterized protein n=1 Tax=Grifola frondosa TaxID=5627 RepID=A0A1C7LKQ7_GRIFR|nr:hypothetical protein A0H81_14737 [Grifola frondosa]